MSGPAARDLERLRAGERPAARRESPDARQADAAWRAAVTEALLADLRPGDHALAIWLLHRELDALGAAGALAPETLYRLIAAVARFARPDDALLIWRAAQATPETRVGVDVEQALRAGPEVVLRALVRRAAHGEADADDAAAALAWVRAGLTAGAGDDLPAYFAWSDERFGLHVSGPT
ncbi:MAG TPA: hypothetical protein VFX24_10820 [Ktedonobacterales bacterium]|jgi:hypothetical protein|nr:hypothetical protein [Ktedonobacterales bacterium]